MMCVDGEIREIVHGMKLDRYKNHSIEIVVDKLCVQQKDDKRLHASVATAMQQGGRATYGLRCRNGDRTSLQ